MLSESNNENSTNQRMFLVFTYLEIGTSIYSRHINLRLRKYLALNGQPT